jgi:membrane protease YdiL (CAAX protease family)
MIRNESPFLTEQVIRDETPGKAANQITHQAQLVELGVFLFLIVPSMVLSFFAFRQGSVGFTLTAIATITRDLALVCLILYFVWRNREPITAIGWTLEHVWREVALGAVLFVPVYFGAGLLERALQAAGFSAPSMPEPSFLSPQGAVQILLASVLVVVVALAEETIFRGYLMLRFKSITACPFAAVVLSSFIFTLGHGYEGAAGVITVGVLGAIYAVVYLRRGSLVAPITMHFLQDFIGIVLVPLLALR